MDAPATIRMLHRSSPSSLFAVAASMLMTFSLAAPALAYGPISSQTCTGIELAPGANIQKAVNDNPGNATFCLASGIYAEQSVIPKSGDRFIGAYGAVLDGRNVTRRAFDGKASNVVVQNLVIRNYTAPAQDAPVHGDYSSGWIVKNNEVAYNAGAGIDLGDRMQAIGNFVHHNLQIGLDMNNITVATGKNIRVDSNEISFNNYLDKYGGGWEEGGAKFWASTNLQVTNNYVHDNHGPALWTDTNNINTSYIGNYIENNLSSGIFHEVSYDAIIAYNVIKNNRGKRLIYGWPDPASILIAASGGVNGGQIEVYGNTIITGSAMNGIGLMQQDRSADPAAYGPHYVQNVYVHDNTVDVSGGAGENGAAEDDQEHLIFTSRNNRFVHNTYYLGANTRAFDWMDKTGDVAFWKGWGQDTAGTFLNSSLPWQGAPTVSLSANPAATASGQPSTIAWSSTNAISCAGSGFSTENAISGAITVTSSATTTYALSCIGGGGRASTSTTLTVNAASAEGGGHPSPRD